uniref:Uncharacterized protein n=1 Tax=Burkholderia sp. (strain CCGE1003) TaxID=640512 RepID=E1TAL0_BURSG
MPQAVRARWTKQRAPLAAALLPHFMKKPPLGWLFHFPPCDGVIRIWRGLAVRLCAFVSVHRRTLLRIVAIVAKARRCGLGRQFACYLDYPFCDMLPGCKF